MNLHTHFAALVGGKSTRAVGGVEPSTPVTGHRLVTGLVPCNVIPDEILTDHPDRFRALLVESGNPVHSIADSQRMREALDALDLVVVIDVALTETARCADYVLPAASQFEKWECTFFNLEFPHNYFHLRRPVFEPMEGTLPEPEIHARLCRALGAYNDDDLAPLHAAAAIGRAEYTAALFGLAAERPAMGKLLPVILYETLGPTLRTADGTVAAGAAAVWGLAQIGRRILGRVGAPRRFQRAGRRFAGRRAVRRAAGQPVRRDVLGRRLRRDDAAPGDVATAGSTSSSRHCSTSSTRWPPSRRRCRPTAPPGDAFPFVLSAGERRSSTANTIYRDPSWRKNDQQGALRVSPADAERFGLDAGERARVTTKRGSAVAVVEVTDVMRDGHISLPNGLGLGRNGDGSDAVGVAPNELTSSDDRDWFAGTPLHKHVRARVEPWCRSRAAP